MSELAETEEQKNVALVKRWFQEVWNEGRIEIIDELLLPETRVHGLPQDPALNGIDGFKQAYSIFRGAFPDVQITLDPIVAQGDKVAAHFVCVATHLGDHLGVPPTGDRVTFSGQTIAKFRDGYLVEGWNVLDLLGVIQSAVAKAALATNH